MTPSGENEDGGGLTLSSMVKEIQGLKDKFKRDDADSPSPFADLEKATVLQECRVFSDSKVVTDSPRKCSQLITKLLHIVTQGDAMSSAEVTEVFFWCYEALPIERCVITQNGLLFYQGGRRNLQS